MVFKSKIKTHIKHSPYGLRREYPGVYLLNNYVIRTPKEKKCLNLRLLLCYHRLAFVRHSHLHIC